jgi:hypothetical protein
VLPQRGVRNAERYNRAESLENVDERGCECGSAGVGGMADVDSEESACGMDGSGWCYVAEATRERTERMEMDVRRASARAERQCVSADSMSSSSLFAYQTCH